MAPRVTNGNASMFATTTTSDAFTTAVYRLGYPYAQQQYQQPILSPQFLPQPILTPMPIGANMTPKKEADEYAWLRKRIKDIEWRD